jgi:uncharacterized protein (DUF111 family)
MGMRATTVERWPAARVLDQVLVDKMTVRMKVTAGRAKPEFDDVARVAAKTGAPIHEVASRAEEAWRAVAHDSTHETDHDTPLATGNSAEEGKDR